jgi:hypothetical protein
MILSKQSEEEKKLLSACENGEQDLILKIMQKNSWNTLKTMSEDVLYKAILGENDVSFIKFLKGLGADIHISKKVKDYGCLEGLEYPLCSACKYGKIDIVKYLIEEENADWKVDKYSAFRFASEFGNVEIAQYLHDLGSPINSMDYYGYLEACLVGHENMVQWFIEKDATILEKVPQGFNSIIANKNYEMCKLLLENGSTPAQITPESWTILLSSNNSGDSPSIHIMSLLYDHGWSLENKNIIHDLENQDRYVADTTKKWINSYFEQKQMNGLLPEKKLNTNIKKNKI